MEIAESESVGEDRTKISDRFRRIYLVRAILHFKQHRNPDVMRDLTRLGPKALRILAIVAEDCLLPNLCDPNFSSPLCSVGNVIPSDSGCSVLHPNGMV